MNIVLALFRKELIDFMRDRRTLFSLVLAPMLIMPLSLFGMSYFMGKAQQTAREKKLVVAWREQTPMAGLRDSLTAAGFDVRPAQDPRGAVEKKEVDAGVEVSGANPQHIRIFFDRSKVEGQVVAGRVRVVVDELKQSRVRASLARYNVPESVLQPFLAENVNVAPPEKMGGAMLGIIIGFMLVLFMLSSGMYPAMDMTAGEKERRTLELLLSSPATRREIILGKLLAVFVATITAAMLSVLSLGLSFYLLSRGGGPMSRANFSFDPGTVALLALATVPMAVFMAALTLAVAAFARSTREATSYLTPLLFVGLAAGYSSMMPGINLNSSAWFVPFANFCKLAKNLLEGEWTWLAFGATFLANTLYATIAYLIAVRNFSDEKVLFRT